jgi:cell wall-associated NlpC family hydrolase
MEDGAHKIRAVAAVAAVTVALALPLAAARAEAAGTPVAGASLEEPVAGSPLGPAEPAVPAAPVGEGVENEAAGGEAGAGEGKGTSEGGEGKDEGRSGNGSGGTVENAPISPEAVRHPKLPPATGGTNAGEQSAEEEEEAKEAEEAGTAIGEGKDAESPLTIPQAPLTIPTLPTSSCASAGVPPVLIPIFRRAAAAYGLGPQGPAVLAGINEVETAFGTNLNISTAGAEGWMQFMPETWSTYGVDANKDGVADPYDPEDAIFAAASYLSAAGMPADTYGAIYSYNHADWYVSEVLANAGCYAEEVGDPAFTESDLSPQIQVLRCEPAPGWRKQVPDAYLEAFESAAARYELGKRGVWALAAVARLESNFGRTLSKKQMREEGPLGLDATEWKHYRVDGDEDGHIRRGDIADAAATLAREIWSKGSLEAGVFAHNQAEWYVSEVMQEAEEIEGGCKVSYVDWRVAPLSTGHETAGPDAVLGPAGLASAPRSAPPAVKAAIAAANSISTTPYVWGGGHGSWYSYGYDCSGAVSFALYGAGLLDTPLTSGSLESYGEPGPGKWITIYASATHAYAVIAGLRWDTVGDASGTGPRWHAEPPYPEGFVVRHPTGY